MLVAVVNLVHTCIDLCTVQVWADIQVPLMDALQQDQEELSSVGSSQLEGTDRRVTLNMRILYVLVFCNMTCNAFGRITVLSVHECRCFVVVAEILFFHPGLLRNEVMRDVGEKLTKGDYTQAVATARAAR